MLYAEADVTTAETFCASDRWWMDQKADGDRLLIELTGDTPKLYNRNREPYTRHVDSAILAELTELGTEGMFILEGELVGIKLWLFDVRFVANRDGQILFDEQDTFEKRRTALEYIGGNFMPSGPVRVIPCRKTAASKRRHFRMLEQLGAEGVIFRAIDAPYKRGKSSNAYKVKFTSTVDCFISDLGIDGKDNCELSVASVDGNGVVVGKCSTLGKDPFAIGDIVEVRYLYIRDIYDPHLVQPRILRKRTDKNPNDCSIDQFERATNKEVQP